MSDTDTDSGKRKQVAKHGYVDAAGQAVERIEQAAGISYKEIATGKEFVYIITPAALPLLAVFGAKTKATNEASAWRQAAAAGDETDSEDQIAAIESAFAQIDTGVWREPGEAGARGPKYDKDVLAAALLQSLGDKAKGDVAHYREKLDDKSYYTKVRAQPSVMAKYLEEMAARGTAAGNVDSLA